MALAYRIDTSIVDLFPSPEIKLPFDLSVLSRSKIKEVVCWNVQSLGLGGRSR